MKLAVIVLTLLLCLTNGWWFFQALDVAVATSYKDQQLFQLEETRKQLMASLPELAANDSKAAVIAAVSNHTSEDVYEKNGCTWAGWLGLQFDEADRLVYISPSWSYGASDTCF